MAWATLLRPAASAGRCRTLGRLRLAPSSSSPACPARRWLAAEASTGAAEGTGAATGAARERVFGVLSDLRGDPDASEASLARLEEASPDLQSILFSAPMPERFALLQKVSSLGAVPSRPYPITGFFLGFLESYVDTLEELREGETVADRAAEIRTVLLCFHRAGVSTERLRFIYTHIERDFPRFEAAGQLLPMTSAVELCHTMLCTGMSTPPAVVVLLRAALREPLMYVDDDSEELRRLKTIEFLLRVDFLHTVEQLPRDVNEYLSIVRSLRYYDRELKRDTPLSYQLAFFLRKHSFPSRRHMLGPYPLKVCDPDERINFEPVEERPFRFGLPEEPPARKRRHLEAVGWRSFEVTASQWQALETYEAKAEHIRGILKENKLMDP